MVNKNSGVISLRWIFISINRTMCRHATLSPKVINLSHDPVAFIYISLLALQICTVIICKIRKLIL